MKDKIFSRLKQAYSPLGLGDEILQAQAESLVSTGLVTDENIEAIVGAQKPFLESLQKANDRRVTSAVQKAAAEAEAKAVQKAADDAKKAEQDKAAEAEKKKAADKAKKEAEKKAAEEDAFKKALDAMRSDNTAFTEQIKTLVEGLASQNAELKKGYDALKKENDDAKAAEVKRQRADKILNKAKELQIPQYRIEEGFSISEEATDEQIAEYLGKVATNVQANRLPADNGLILSDAPAEKSEVDAMVANMIR